MDFMLAGFKLDGHTQIAWSMWDLVWFSPFLSDIFLLFICLFLRLYFKYISPLSLFKLSHMPLTESFKFTDDFYESLVHAYMCFYVHMYMYICIQKCNLSSRYNVNCIYVFKTASLAPHNQLVCSSLGRNTSSVPKFT